MTRPSEAEVEKFPLQWSDPDNDCAQWRARYDGLAVKCEALRQDLSPSGRESYRVALARKDAAFVEILRLAALSTPPLPSAEPVAEGVREIPRQLPGGCSDCEDTHAYENCPHAQRSTEPVVQTPEGPMQLACWSCRMVKLATPPAAAQDTARLDVRFCEFVGSPPFGETWHDYLESCINGETVNLRGLTIAARAAGGE